MAERRARAHLMAISRGLGASINPSTPAAAGVAAAATSGVASTSSVAGVKEWHFHVYFHLDEASIARASVLREKLIEAVRAEELVVVLNGVDAEVLPQLTTESVEQLPNFNTRPMGPHPEGSFEVWCPGEQLGAALSFLTVRQQCLFAPF
jgi:aromatic ring-cleaving dioxygenase